MDELGASVSFWHWIVLGVVFVTAEAFVPGAFFLGMGVSALVVGGALFAVPGMDWKLQLFAFAVLSGGMYAQAISPSILFVGVPSGLNPSLCVSRLRICARWRTINWRRRSAQEEVLVAGRSAIVSGSPSAKR